MAAASVSSWLYENRPLKRPKLGPPDVYPQDPKQKEDELTAVNVKQGFSNSVVIQDEYGSARNSNITANRFGSYFSALLSKKLELNTLQDTTRKKQQINTKDNIWLVTSKSKNAVDAWFKDLSSNAKTLSQLSRKFPIFNKKEEIFSQLYEFQVPMFKAEWFVKMSCTYQIALSESNNKSKKRQLPDPSQEWTNALCRFLREQYQKLCEHYHGLSSTSSVTSAAAVTSDIIPKQWQYYTQFSRHLFEGGLLDRHDFLCWLLDLLEKVKSIDDTVISIVIQLLLQYVEDFTQSELLARKLAYHCAKKLSQLIADYNDNNPSNSLSPSNDSEIAQNLNGKTNSANNSSNTSSVLNAGNNGGNSSNTSVSASNNQSFGTSLVNCFTELMSCAHHRNVILGLSVIIQIITIDCPTAMIWHNVGEGRAALHGSPLDNLPCEPSNLPMPTRPHNQYLRNELRRAEDQIRQRSKMSEMHWSCDRWQQTSGTIVSKLLNVLDALDRHCFDKVDSNNSIDTLYSKIFSNISISSGASSNSNSNSNSNTNNSNANVSSNEPQTVPSIADILAEDEPITKLLCEWAVTTKRTGEHRALVVAKLLEKRQSELTAEKENDNIDDNDTDITNANVPNSNSSFSNSNTNKSDSILSTPIYQNLLLNFLDNQAPIYEDRNGISNTENKQAFCNLILLFGELIRCEVFSHDSYMCALISRGQFSNSPNNSLLPHSVASLKPVIEEPSLAGFVPNLSSSGDLQSLASSHLGSLMPSGIQRSTSGSSLPMFDPLSNHSNSGPADQTRWEAPALDMDDPQAIDEDLDKILQHIKAGQQNMNDQTDILLPDSVGSDKEDEPNSVLGHSSAFSSAEPSSKNTVARHLLYTMHFPLPQDETSAHDCNQRHILLYGVGKAKDEARHIVKKITKEITKLFNRKSSMDISDGGKVKKHAIKEGFNFESAISKFQSLSTFDQHVVTTSCSTSVVEMFNGVATGNANYLPLIESIAFLFDLMEMALNVHGLIEFIIQMLKELVEVDIQLHQKCPILARTYSTSIGLYIVGVLYRYQNCLLVSYEETFSVFEGLWKIVRHVSIPSDCSSAERCILYYLYDLYSSYSHLRAKYHEVVNIMFSKIKIMNSMQMKLGDGTPNMRFNQACMMEYLKNPKLKVDPMHIRQLNENSADRYSFVCNAIQCISCSTDIDKLNEMSVLCAELTASCSNLCIEWLSVLKALCCSSNHTCGYYDLLTQIEVGDLSIHDNLAVFTSILIARRCFSLQDFLINVAVPSLLACSDGAEDADGGARLTCHLLLCLFKTSDSPLSSNTMTSFATSSRYSLTSPGPSVLSTTPPHPGQRPLYIIKYPCDRYLLAAAHSTLRVEIVLTVLKAILVLGNLAEKRGENKPKTDVKGELSISDILGPIGGDEDFGDLNSILPLAGKPGVSRMDGLEKAGLSDAAKYALKQICSQQWVHDRCLRGFMNDPEILNKLLLDPKFLTHKDAQHLLNLICHPKLVALNSLQEIDSDQKQAISKILNNLDEWTIRVSWLQLQLMFVQCSSQTSSEVNGWLDNVAKATVDYFQTSSEEFSKNAPMSTQLSIFCSRNGTKGSNFKQSHHLSDSQKDRVWLISPLISKLPPTVQGKILKVAANVLESGNWMSNGFNQSSSSSSYSSSKNKDRGFQQQKNSSNSNSSISTSSMLLSHPPFLSLVLLCLKGQDEQRESLLSSLYNQLSQAINEKLCDDIKAKHSIQEGLQLRLSLVGGMFDLIQRSSSLINDWAILLVQLISFTIVDPQINYEIFTTVLDMIAILMHTTQVTDSSEPREETKKQYQNLIKKIKKELHIDRITPGIRMVQQLLPIVKQQCEVITCEPMGSLIDTKGNKIAGFDSIDKKQGLQVAEKQKVSPWDLLEGHKNPSPLSWTWFGALRIERKPLRTEENHFLLSRHNHSIKKPTSYYIEPPPLPPEDVIEQIAAPTLPPITNERINPMVTHHAPQMMPTPPVMPMMDDHIRREIMIDPTPRAATPKKQKVQRRRRQTKNATNGSTGQQTPPIRMPSGYDAGYGVPPPHQPTAPQTWYSGHPQQTPANPPPPPMQSQQAYYPQQQQMVTPRFTETVRPQGGRSKDALRAMLGSRHPNASQFNMQNANPPPNQGMMTPAVAPQNVYQGRQQIMIQRQLRPPQPPQQLSAPQSAMYQMQANTQPVVPQTAQMHHMNVAPQQNYGAPPNMAFNNSMQMQAAMDQSMQAPQSSHPPPGYHNATQQNQMLMRTQMQQQPQMVASQPPPQQQFITQRSQYGGMQAAPNVTMGQLGSGQIDNRANAYNQQSNIQAMAPTAAQHMTPQWQSNAHVVTRAQQPVLQSQLQRQLSASNSQQHNPYHQTQY